MAPAKKSSSKTKKPAARKAAPAKAKSKPASKPAAKAAVRATPTHAAAAARSASIHLHPVAAKSRKGANWVEQAIANAQENPAVSLVCIIAAAVGIFLLFS